MTHKMLATHYFHDAIDLLLRLRIDWQDQPRKSSRVKSFVDLVMACECMLKAKCIMASRHLPLTDAYKTIKSLGHNIDKLANLADQTFPSEANVRARNHFRNFGIELRYSVDAHEYFFLFGEKPQQGRHSYSSTLGNADWMREAESIVEELVQWGKEAFNGEVTDDIDSILTGRLELAEIVRPRRRQIQ